MHLRKRFKPLQALHAMRCDCERLQSGQSRNICIVRDLYGFTAQLERRECFQLPDRPQVIHSIGKRHLQFLKCRQTHPGQQLR